MLSMESVKRRRKICLSNPVQGSLPCSIPPKSSSLGGYSAVSLCLNASNGLRRSRPDSPVEGNVGKGQTANCIMVHFRETQPEPKNAELHCTQAARLNGAT